MYDILTTKQFLLNVKTEVDKRFKNTLTKAELTLRSNLGLGIKDLHFSKYSKTYTDYKFVPQDIWDKLINKHGLLEKEFRHYIKDVPLNVMKDLETFMLSRYRVYRNTKYSQEVVLEDVSLEEATKYIDSRRILKFFNFSGLKYENLSTKNSFFTILAPADHFIYHKGDSISNSSEFDPVAIKIVKGGRVIIKTWTS